MKCNDVRLYEYLDGRLDPDEARRTAAHLENCAACRERFKIMEALDREDMVDSRPKQSSGVSPGKKWMLMAAAITLAVLVSILYSLLPGSSNPPALALLATRQPYPLVTLETRDGTEKNLPRGILLYREGRYREALAELKKAEGDPDALFFSGISLYLLDEPAQAAETLKRVAEISEKWANPADWYYSQALLKMGLKDEALKVLQRLANTDNHYRAEAEAQLAKIQRK